MPVLVPCTKSTEYVNAVRCDSVLSRTISGMSSSSSRSPSSGAQITPEVCRTKNVIFSGVAVSAAMMRSPSFSRSSSSTTTMISPLAIAATASSIGAKTELDEPCWSSASRLMSALRRFGAPSVVAQFELSDEQSLGVLGHHVHLEVHGVARRP